MLDPSLPLSLVLGAGGARGVAHVGILEGLVERGFRVTEIVGSSVGALIAAYYGCVGLDLPKLRELGLSFSSRQLIAWAAARRAPAFLAHRLKRRAGIIPSYLDLLEHAPTDRLFHGIERVGVQTYDLNRNEEVLFHSGMDEFPLCDATRGAVAIPKFYPMREFVHRGRAYRLIDGGVYNRIPIEWLFTELFSPRQILVVDIANRVEHRRENAEKIARVGAAHPDIPIHIATPDTLGRGTILFRRSGLTSLIDSGRETVALAVG
jgi:NTE family protein